MAQVTDSFTAAGQASAYLNVFPSDSFAWNVSGTFNGVVQIRGTVDNGDSSFIIYVINAASSGTYEVVAKTLGVTSDVDFFFICTEYTSGTIDVSLEDVDVVLKEYDNAAGDTIFQLTDAGLTINGDLVVSGSQVLGGDAAIENLELTGELTASSVTASNFLSNETDGTALQLGSTVTEGICLKVLEESVDLTGAGAAYKAMSSAIPTNSIILSAQANIASTVTAGGTTVKIALGLHAGDVDKYGITTDLTQNQKIDTMATPTVLSGSEQIDVCGVTSDGSALGDSNLTGGMVRVRIVYQTLLSLDDA